MIYQLQSVFVLCSLLNPLNLILFMTFLLLVNHVLPCNYYLVLNNLCILQSHSNYRAIGDNNVSEALILS